MSCNILPLHWEKNTKKLFIYIVIQIRHRRLLSKKPLLGMAWLCCIQSIGHVLSIETSANRKGQQCLVNKMGGVGSKKGKILVTYFMNAF